MSVLAIPAATADLISESPIAKWAETLLAPAIITVQMLPDTESQPVQPEKKEPAAAVGNNVTEVPPANVLLQLALQSAVDVDASIATIP
jgi:hypothetical protein